MPGSCLTLKLSLAGQAGITSQRYGGRGDSDWRAYLANFVKTLVIVPALLVGLPVLQAAASTGSDDARPAQRRLRPMQRAIQLAQYGNVEIYIDEYGRRVIVDSFTGEVLGVERPRAYRNREAYRRALRARELGRDPGYDIFDPNYEVPYRPRALDEVPEYPPESPEYAYPEERSPEAPQTPIPRRPEVVTREPLRRPARKAGRQVSGNGPPRATGMATATIDGGSSRVATEPAITFGARDQVAALQVLLDRKGASPGVIDGQFGSNVDKALDAYRDITGENLHSTDTAAHQDRRSPRPAATPSPPIRSRRRMRPGPTSPPCRPTTARRPSSTG